MEILPRQHNITRHMQILRLMLEHVMFAERPEKGKGVTGVIVNFKSSQLSTAQILPACNVHVSMAV